MPFILLLFTLNMTNRQKYDSYHILRGVDTTLYGPKQLKVVFIKLKDLLFSSCTQELITPALLLPLFLLVLLLLLIIIIVINYYYHY